MGITSERAGAKTSKRMGGFLVFGAFALALIYVTTGIYPAAALLVFRTFPTALKAHRYVSQFKGLRIPYTNSLHWKFTLLVIVTLVFG